jgi:hypothetical protein
MAVLKGPDHVFELANPAYMALVGDRTVLGKSLHEALPEVVDQGFVELLDRVRATGEPFIGNGVKVRLARGEDGKVEERVIDFVYQPITGADGGISGVFVEGTDVTQRVHAETLRIAQNRILEAAVEESSLGGALERLVRVVEDISPSGALGSLLLLSEDGRHLNHGAAPSLPVAYNERIDGMEIGSGQGSCGTAAFEKRPIYVADIARDPLWADFRDLAIEHRLRACWSTPIFGSNGAVLGTFAIYYGEPREPAPASHVSRHLQTLS